MTLSRSISTGQIAAEGHQENGDDHAISADSNARTVIASPAIVGRFRRHGPQSEGIVTLDTELRFTGRANCMG